MEQHAPTIVCFDVGEVLIDETRVWSTWAGLIGVSPLTFASVLGAAIAQGDDWPAAFAHVAPNIEWSALEDDHEAQYGGFQEQDLYPDVRRCLDDLRGLGLRVVICGNQPARRQEQLRSLELGVEEIITSEDLGAEKPSPEFFSLLLAELGVSDPSEVLYVGDRVDNDVIPALEAGLRVCWLQRGPWGQLQEADDELDVDLVLEGLGELPELLRAWHQPDHDKQHHDQPDRDKRADT